MKFLVLATTLSLSAAQGFFGLQAHPNGAITPIDEPRVAALKADHLATKFGAGPFLAAGPVAVAGPAYAAAGPAYAAAPVAVAGPVYGAGYAAGFGYNGPLNLNTHLVAHPNGAVVPVDEPAVAAARADHFAAVGGVYAAAPVAYGAGYGYGAGAFGLVAHPNGAVVPVDEPAVQAARADHFAAKGAIAVVGPAYAAAPIAVAGPVYGAGYAAGYGYNGPLNLNTHLVAHPNGAVVPVDEPAVAAARADHFAIGGGQAGPILAGPIAVGGVYAAAPVAYGPGYGYGAGNGYGAGYGYGAGAFGLVAHPNSAVVPVDEPAVQAARADHFAAKSAIY